MIQIEGLLRLLTKWNTNDWSERNLVAGAKQKSPSVQNVVRISFFL